MKPFLLLFFLISSSLHSQEENVTDIDLITDTASAEEFIKTNKTKGNKLITFNEEKHKSVLATDLFKLSVGGKSTTENNYDIITYKVIEKNSITHYRVSYILLNGKGNEAIKDKIVTDYNNGLPFGLLAKEYSVADNATRGGDTGWFTKEEVTLIFDSDITENTHAENEIYTIENQPNGHYYIILNTYQPKEIKEIKVLKIVEPKS